MVNVSVFSIVPFIHFFLYTRDHFSAFTSPERLNWNRSFPPRASATAPFGETCITPPVSRIVWDTDELRALGLFTGALGILLVTFTDCQDWDT